MNALFARLGLSNDLIFVAMLIFVIAMLIIPLPTMLIDILLAINLAISVIILMVAIYLRSVLDITTFPAILLVTTIFRLALTVSTTRAILGTGDAGHIVAAFGNFVVAGNLVVGMIIFFIVSLVQFMVITKGAERIAEVGARFTLDSLPGKQMAIDADVRAGEITKEEAKRRRADLEKEMQFHGSMDGAMKFVKGDAIAGIIVIFVNLIGGTIIGVLQRGLPFGEALRTYSLLTVGDGLIAQIPAMLISVAAGVIVTRVQDDVPSNVGSDIGKQLLTNPKALAIAAVLCVGLGLLPGFPLIVFIAIAAGLVLLSRNLLKAAKKEAAAAEAGNVGADGQSGAQVAKPLEPFVPYVSGGMTFAIVGSPDLRKQLEANGFSDRFWVHYIKETERIGFKRLAPGFQEVEGASGLTLAKNGVPFFSMSEEECLADPDNSLKLIVAQRDHLSSTFDAEMAVLWLESNKQAFAKLVGEIEQSIPILFMVDVIRDLLEDGVTLAHPRPVLEALLRAKDIGANVGAVADVARAGLKPVLTRAVLSENGKLPAVMMDMPTEEKFRQMTDGNVNNAQFIVRDQGMAAMLQQARNFLKQTRSANSTLAVICPSDIRRAFRAMLRAANVQIPVIGISEIEPTTEIQRVGVLSAQAKG